jgi:hypothetical protein
MTNYEVHEAVIRIIEGLYIPNSTWKKEQNLFVMANLESICSALTEFIIH